MAPAQPTASVKRHVVAARLAPLLRWTLVFIYAWSAGGKFFWPERFREILLGTGMVPPEFVTPLAYGLPSTELLLAVALAAKLLLPIGLLLSVFYATVFGGLHGYLVACGIVVPCGCCGVAIDFSSQQWHVSLLALSVAMTVGSVALLFHVGQRPPSRAAGTTVPE